MQPSDPRERKKLILAIVLAGAISVTLLILGFFGHLGTMLDRFWDIFKDRAHLRSYIESWGVWAPLAFIGLQALQVIIAPVPGELTGAVGGFVFGGLPTIVYSTIGLATGSLINFVLARIIGLPFVKLAVSEETLERFHFLTQRRGALLAFVLFAIPGFPKDILSYILGLSPMSLVTFAIVCTVGRIPGTVMLSYSGSAVYHENWSLLIAIGAVCAVSLVAMFFWRDKIEQWLHHKSRDSRH